MRAESAGSAPDAVGAGAGQSCGPFGREGYALDIRPTTGPSNLPGGTRFAVIEAEPNRENGEYTGLRRSTRIAGSSILVLLLAAGVALFFSQSRVASLVKAVAGIEAAAERLMTEAVGARVSIVSIETSLSRGEMRIRGLAVRNPEGFRTRAALEADEIRIVVDLGTLLEKTVVIREIAVERPLVTYEIGPDGSNLEAIRQNVQSFTKSGNEPGRPRSSTRIVIENLYVRDGTVAASAVFLEGKSLEAPFPDLHLRNLSTGEGGTAAAGIVEEVTSEIVKDVRESVAPLGGIAEEMRDRIAGGASRVVGEARREIEEGSDSARNALEEGAESVERELDRKVDAARDTLERGAESAREALERGAGSAREALQKGTDSAQEALERGADSSREALERGTESAREAVDRGADKVKDALKKLLGKKSETE